MCKIILLVNTPVNSSHIKHDPFNNDGFGIAFCQDDQHRLYHSITNCEYDSNIERLFPLITYSQWVLIHHRKGTNREISVYNCHPFTYNNITFAHVGECAIHYNDRKKIINEIDDNLLLLIKGNTDTEYLFYLIITNFVKFNDIKKAIISSIELISIYDCCINAVLIINNQIYVISYNNYLQNASCFHYDINRQMLQTIDYDCSNSTVFDGTLIRPTNELQIWYFENNKLLKII